MSAKLDLPDEMVLVLKDESNLFVDLRKFRKEQLVRLLHRGLLQAAYDGTAALPRKDTDPAVMREAALKGLRRFGYYGD